MTLSIFDRFITQTESGETIPSAVLTVNNTGASTGLATLWQDRDGTIPAGNPITADVNGRVQFYAEPDRYNMSATYSGGSISYPDILVGGVASEVSLDINGNVTDVGAYLNAEYADDYADARVRLAADEYAEGQMFFVKGYPAPWQVQSGTAPADSGFILVGGTAWAKSTSPTLSLSIFGATDSSAIDTALSAAITYSKANDYQEVDFDVTDWALSTEMPQVNSSFDAVKFTSSLSRRSVGVCDTITTPHFKYAGGSGRLFGVGWENIDITKASGTLFEVKGFGGLRFYNSKFDVDIFAALSNDIGVGTFTEFAEIVGGEVSCNQLYSMTRGAGENSFHGCGFSGNAVINQKTGTTVPLILVGAVTDGTNDIYWYNAPMEGQVFTRSNQPIVINGNDNAAINITSSKGSLSFEDFGNTVELFQGNVDHYHGGAIVGFSEIVGIGNLVLIDQCETTVSGRIGKGTARPRRYIDTKAALATWGTLGTIVSDDTLDPEYTTFTLSGTAVDTPESGYAVIDRTGTREDVAFTRVGNTITLTSRGLNGTLVAAHLIGVDFDAEADTLTTTITDGGHGSLCLISCSAPNYEYQQLVMVVGRISGGISPSAQVISTGRSFNTAAYGAPVPQITDNTLEIYNASWSAAEVTIKIVQMGRALQFNDF